MEKIAEGWARARGIEGRRRDGRAGSTSSTVHLGVGLRVGGCKSGRSEKRRSGGSIGLWRRRRRWTLHPLNKPAVLGKSRHRKLVRVLAPPSALGDGTVLGVVWR